MSSCLVLVWFVFQLLLLLLLFVAVTTAAAATLAATATAVSATTSAAAPSLHDALPSQVQTLPPRNLIRRVCGCREGGDVTTSPASLGLYTDPSMGNVLRSCEPFDSGARLHSSATCVLCPVVVTSAWVCSSTHESAHLYTTYNVQCIHSRLRTPDDALAAKSRQSRQSLATWNPRP